MKYTLIPLILHIPDNVDTEATILMLKDYAESQSSKIMVCEASEWKESDDLVFITPNLTALPKAERQF
jgi:hypothetical protein